MKSKVILNIAISVIPFNDKVVVRKVIKYQRGVDNMISTYIHALRSNGEWIFVMEGSMWPEDCYLDFWKRDKDCQSLK